MPHEPGEKQSAAAGGHSAPPLGIIGIGEDGIDGLNSAARQVLYEADYIFGGARQLALLPADLQAKGKEWQQPFLANIDLIRALRQKAGFAESIAVLASGDPMFFGAGATFSRYFAASELTVYPHISSFSYAAARLGWALQTAQCVSVHGRPLGLALRFAEDKARLLILAQDGGSAAALAALFCGRGFGKSRFTVLEHLGGAHERIAHFDAAALAQNPQQFAALNIIAVECAAEAPAFNLPLYTALPDSAFTHDGQLSKQPVRAAVLAALAPKYGELLWNIGAGSGAIAIEWLRLGRQTAAIAVESRADRLANIKANAAHLGVPHLQAVQGFAADVIPSLLGAVPDAVFVGGGVSDFALLEQCFAALKSGGRLAANAVTLEGEAALARFAEKYGGRRMRFAVQNEEALGTKHILRPALPVYFLLSEKT